MGQTASIPQSIPPLSEDTDDSDDEVLLLDRILGSEDGTNAEVKEEEVSIVFFDEDDEEDVDAENDIYYDDRDSCTDDYRCFGLPLFSITTHFSAVAALTDNGKDSSNNDNEDEDPRENIESLQLELKVVDAFYNHHTRNTKNKTENVQEQKEEEEADQRDDIADDEEEEKDEDEDPKEDVESLQRELQRAEESFVPPENKATESNNDCDSSIQMSGGEEQSSHRSSSFIDLQQLFFSSSVTVNDDNYSIAKNGSVSSAASLFSSSTTSNSCRVVEIYETRTTQLKPQPEDEKEQVPLERRGIPFRKCRNPSCSCHHPTAKNRDNRSRHRDRNKSMIDKYHLNHHVDGTNDDDSSTMLESRQLKRRSALHRLQKQREKLLAMNHDEDDRTEATAGSSSSSSRYSGYSIRSDCQISSRKNQTILDNNGTLNTDRGHRRQRSRSEDFDQRFTHGVSSSGATCMVISPETLPSVASSTATPSPYPMPSQFSSATTIPQSDSSNDSNRRQQQQPPPPLPSRRSFGGSSNHKHTTYPSLLIQGSQPLRKLGSQSLFEDDANGTFRRCRSEDFIDGNSAGGIVESSGISKTLKDSALSSAIFRNTQHKNQSAILLSESLDNGGGKTSKDGDERSILERHSMSSSPSNALERNIPLVGHATPDAMHGCGAVPVQEEDRASATEEVKDLSFLNSPTCIMDEIHCNGSYRRSRTTQNQHSLEHLDRIHQQRRQDPNNIIGLPAANHDDDSPDHSRLFDERERSLTEYRTSIRILQNEEKMDRRQKLSIPTIETTTLGRDSRKQQKRRRQQQQQREFRRAMKLADFYHNMGLIHYQQGRYDTARRVLQCGVDALISNRASCVPLAQEAVDEATDPFDDDYSNPYYACAPSRLLPLLPTLDEAAPHLSNKALLLAAELILAQGKILAAQGLWNATKQSSGKVLQWSVFQKQRLLDNINPPPSSPHHHRRAAEQHNKYWKDWGPTIARAQVLFARCFEKEHRPDIAMGYYQEALSVQKRTLSPGHDVQAADTLYRMGNLHANSGFLGLAGQRYDEALCLYRHHKILTARTTTTVEDCVSADEATVLAGLGWIFLVQNDLGRALALTNEALDAMVQILGSSHRNVLSLKHQLAFIQKSLLAFPERNN